MNYANILVEWVLAHMKQIRLLALAAVVLYEIRAVALLAIAVGLLYWVAPEVRPYWNNSLLYFVAGLRTLVSTQ